ncbi:MAG: penicillin-binding protein [Lachnospiraceae bacterium]|nr:penicillin-binding protein [Lachnospiraceae bacterium]
MYDDIRDNLIGVLKSRLLILFVLIVLFGAVLIHRVFDLQIVNGESYLQDFQMTIEKTRSIKATRGNIFDRNGVLLAYNELAYSVNIEDVFESGSTKNEKLNAMIQSLIGIIEDNGDEVLSDFGISINKRGDFYFTQEGSRQLRFLADVYGRIDPDDLEYKELNATPTDVVEYLCGRSKFGIGEYTDPDDKNSFVPGGGYEPEELLKILTIRYNMNTNSFQKYIATTVATDVSKETVAVVLENIDDLPGVSISEDTIRKYNYSKYMSHIIGYTGKIDRDELAELQPLNSDYDLNDTVGKSGIESSMELQLQGTKGRETVYVDNVGKEISTTDYTPPIAGDDIYLTIDKDLQIAATDIIETKLAAIILAKLANIKEYKPSENSSSADIVIPIYSVYYSCIENNVIDIDHFTDKYASETETAVYETYKDKYARVLATIEDELYNTRTHYEDLGKEYQVYESLIASRLYSDGVIIDSEVDRNDPVYIAWTSDETISLAEYIEYCIARNWIDVSLLEINDEYSDSSQIFDGIAAYINKSILQDNSEFTNKLYKYMLLNDEITGRQICQILLDQDIVDIPETEYKSFISGGETAYAFMHNRIADKDLTPADLALDPCTGSIVVTDVNTGEVLALVSYPSYDNNKMANGVDATYYAKIRESQASPLINYATFQKTAPGSTFKMVMATAGLMEDIIDTTSTISCTGIFDKIDTPARCWIYPGTHGSINVTGGIRYSCNCFFYEVGYRLSTISGAFNSDTGLERIAKYADMYGLSETSGIQIDEATPEISDMDPVRSSIGQGTHNYTTAGLARYVTAVANSGTCYNLTLVDKSTDYAGNIKDEYPATVRNTIVMPDAYWDAIHAGMRGVVESKAYYSDLAVNVAGKTGTAQESKSRPNHALFVSYAPYEAPEISVTVRVANGYTSDYAAQIAREVYKYYFGLITEEQVDEMLEIEEGTINGD